MHFQLRNAKELQTVSASSILGIRKQKIGGDPGTFAEIFVNFTGTVMVFELLCGQVDISLMGKMNSIFLSSIHQLIDRALPEVEHAMG